MDPHHWIDITYVNRTKTIELALRKGLRVKSLMFSNKNVLKDIWISTNSRYSNQIDHLLVNKEFSNNIMDIRTYRGAVSKFKSRNSRCKVTKDTIEKVSQIQSQQRRNWATNQKTQNLIDTRK